jgi:L-ribulose-5-phosphate 4-epimerase
MFKGRTVRLNQQIVDQGLVILTWGNGSIIDRDRGLIYIKPSGVNVNVLVDDDISVVDINTNKHISGKKPSVDTSIHTEIYRHFNHIDTIIHTHSLYGTAYAQARRPIPCLGTTHADYFHGEIPVVYDLTPEEVAYNYEQNTGRSIVHYFMDHDIDHTHMSGCLVPSHGVFVWGRSNALEAAIVLEHVAKLAYMTSNIDPNLAPVSDHLTDKHFLRKHGEGKYYGQ